MVEMRESKKHDDSRANATLVADVKRSNKKGKAGAAASKEGKKPHFKLKNKKDGTKITCYGCGENGYKKF